MSIRCPTCARVNPDAAAYCYYDGRALAHAAHAGPAGVGTAPFPTPFVFPDGCSCATFNQLALACDRRWNDARSLLVGGALQWFFSTLGRGDLAAAAGQAARDPDPDAGLTRLIERLPADPDAIQPPRLGLPIEVEDLGTLRPGTDTRFELVVANQGMLILRGTVMTDCDWLCFGERQGDAWVKLFQTRDSYTLPVQVLSSRLRAGQKPLEGRILVDTNGGTATVLVRASVPVRPFPGAAGENVLAGARSPRELAVKARAHPAEAATQFEQGAVKAWYESNGWTYPVQGTQGKGKGGVQQFFEALGLAKPPKLEIDAERIVVRGRPGQRLTRSVTIRTAESKFVHATACSTEAWVNVLPEKPHGNHLTVPLQIDVPPRPGESLQATVTVLGNGGQRFFVPVTLTVAAGETEDEDGPAPRGRGRQLVLAVAAGMLLALPVGLGALWLTHRDGAPPTPPGLVHTPPPAPPAPPPAAPVVWWDAIPGAEIAARAAELTTAAPAEKAVVIAVSAAAPADRYKGYEQLANRLADLAGNPAARGPLGRLVTACLVHDPSDLSLAPLLRGIATQLPRDGVAFRPEGKPADEIERAAFWLRVATDALTHQAIRPDRAGAVRHEVGRAFAFGLDGPSGEFAAESERVLATRLYRNTVPTAAVSVDQALAARDALLAAYARHLTPDVRAPVDVEVLTVGLAREPAAWSRLQPLFKACLDNKEPAVVTQVVLVYERASDELAKEMEPLLAARWEVAANPKLAHAAKVKAIRKRLAGGAAESRLTAIRRLARVEQLTQTALSALDPAQKQETALLQDTVRLTHASTMTCLLLHPREEDDRFDELIAKVPEIEPPKPGAAGSDAKTTAARTPPPGPVRVVLNGLQPFSVQANLTAGHERDPRRRTFAQRYSVSMRAGLTYTVTMQATDLVPCVQVRSSAGAVLVTNEGGNGLAYARLTFNPRTNGTYRVVATTVRPDETGSYTLTIAQDSGFGMFRPFPFGLPPVGGQSDGNAGKSAGQEKHTELANLASKQGDVRTAAFASLAASRDLRPPQAFKLARYVLTITAQPEFDAAAAKLPALAESGPVLQAVADVVSTEKVTQERAEAVVGGLLGQPVKFARDEDWQTGCRRLLLQRALDLAAPPTTSGDQAAEILRDLYKEQGLALGIDDADLQAQTRPTRVLDRLIRHVAVNTTARQPPPPEVDYLRQIDRHLRAAEFVADNDLEQMVLLQRIWARVLAAYLREQVPAKAKALAAVEQELAAGDRTARTVLDQLRSGEEKVARLWALARGAK